MSEFPSPPHRRIEDCALIGDWTSGAFVSNHGSVDWLCWPRFDSATCFAALLGSADHGRWRVAPKADASVSRFYREGTLILVTQFMLSEGLVELIDFMPLGSEVPQLIRIIRGLSGRVMMISNLALRFEYGSALPWVEALDDGSIRAICGPEMAVLYPSVPHRRCFHHVAIHAIDFDATLKFYTEGLGYSVRFKFSVPGRIDLPRHGRRPLHRSVRPGLHRAVRGPEAASG